jgi:hypothetical protein
LKHSCGHGLQTKQFPNQEDFFCIVEDTLFLERIHGDI